MRYSNRDIQKIVGLTSRQVSYYAERGIVTPEFRDASGPGSTRWYSRRDVGKLLLVKGLRDIQGLDFPKVKVIVTIVSAFFDELHQLLGEGDSQIPMVLHLLDGQYGYLETADGGHHTRVFEITRGGRARFSSASPSELAREATFHLSVNLAKVVAPLKNRARR